MALNLRTKLELTKTDPGLVLSFQNTPDQPDEYLEQRLGRDYLEYLKMQRDCEIRRCMTRLINSIIGRSVVVSPASDSRADRKVAAFFQDLIGYERKGSPIRYERMNAALLRTGQIVGFSVLRIDWINDGELVLPRFEFVPQRRFIFCYPEPERRDIPVATDENLDPETEIILVNGYELRLLTKRAPYTGERCPKNRFLVYTFDSESPWGMGLGYSTYPWWQVKREATTSLLMRSDLDGQPPAIGNHPASFKDDHPAVLQLERFLEGISPNNWARLPEGFSASIMDTIGKAGAEVQTSLITIANHEICKVILGEILYSEKASGSYAANISQVEDRESSLIDGYCNLLDEQLVEFWQQIHQYNRLPGDPAIVHRETRADERATELERSRQEAKKERVDLDKALADLGIRLKQSAIADIYGEEYIDTTALQDGEDKQALVATLGVGGTQALISFLGSLQTLGMSRDNAIAALTGIFGVPADVADKIIPDAQPEEAAPPATLEDVIAGTLGDQAGEAPQQFDEWGIPHMDFRAVIDRVVKHNDLSIGLEYLPGQVRFPGSVHAKKLRLGYGHLRNYVGNDGEALDIYIHPEFLGGEPPADSRLFMIDQLSLEDGDFDEHKLMLMPVGATEQQAIAAYTQEMSADHFGGCKEITLADLEQYRKPKPQDFTQDAVPNYRMAPGVSACIECQHGVDHGGGLRCGLYHFAVDPEFICDSYTTEGGEFGEGDLEAELAAIFDPSISFATAKSAGKQKNCTPGKSHWCQTPGGKGSCISIKKQCRYKPGGTAQQVANTIAGSTQKSKSAKTNPRLKDIDDLSTAINKGDFDTAADISDRVYDRAKKLAPDEQTFYQGINAGNGSVEDFILKEIYAARGFDGKPTQVKAADIDQAFANGEMVAYRAMGSTQARFDQHFKNFKNGDYFAGHGIYGHGTYVAYASTGTRHTRSMAASAAGAYGSGVMRMSIDPSAKILKQSQQQKQISKLEKDFDSWATRQQQSVPRPSQSDIDAEKQRLFNGYKPTFTRSFSGLFGNDSYDLSMKNAKGQFIDGLGSFTKATRQGKQGYEFEDASGAAQFVSTRKEAISGLINAYSEKSAIANNPQVAQVKQKINRVKSVLFGDVDSGNRTSGRLAAIQGYDAIALDKAYDPTYMNLLNRSKVRVQSTPGTLFVP